MRRAVEIRLDYLSQGLIPVLAGFISELSQEFSFLWTKADIIRVSRYLFISLGLYILSSLIIPLLPCTRTDELSEFFRFLNEDRRGYCQV